MGQRQYQDKKNLGFNHVWSVKWIWMNKLVYCTLRYYWLQTHGNNDMKELLSYYGISSLVSVPVGLHKIISVLRSMFSPFESSRCKT